MRAALVRAEAELAAEERVAAQQHGQSAPFGSAPAQLLCLYRGCV